MDIVFSIFMYTLSTSYAAPTSTMILHKTFVLVDRFDGRRLSSTTTPVSTIFYGHRGGYSQLKIIHMLMVRSIIGNTKVLVRLSFGVDSSKEVAMKLSVRSENESPIHCSCLVSFSQWLLLEGGCWVVCMECSKVNSFLARNFSNVKDVAEGMKKLRICRRSKGAIAPLFEILLTAGTTGNKSGSITVPNKYAEAYFPEVTDAQGIPLEFVYDDGVNEWSLSVCSDLDKTYVLDGLEEYMSSNNLQEGDTCNNI